MSRKWEGKPQIGRKYLQKTMSDKGLLSKIYKEHFKLNKKKMNNSIKKWRKIMKRQVIKEGIHMASKHMKRCSTSYVVRELKIKTTVWYHYTPIEMTKTQSTENTDVDVEQQEFSFIAGGNATWYSNFGTQFGSSLQN